MYNRKPPARAPKGGQWVLVVEGGRFATPERSGRWKPAARPTARPARKRGAKADDAPRPSKKRNPWWL